MTPVGTALVAASADAQAIPSPTLFVVIYVLLWAGLLMWLAWLITRQRRLEQTVAELQSRLLKRLDDDSPTAVE